MLVSQGSGRRSNSSAIDSSSSLRISRVKLGHGGAASVWLGVYTDSTGADVPCAVKKKFISSTCPSQSPHPVEVPLEEHSETNMLAHIGPHPHIIPLLGSHDSRNYHYCALELMSTDLGKELKEGRAPRNLETVQYLVHRLLQAVSHVHHNHVAHRDVKPSNILLRGTTAADGTALLIPTLSDFGSAHSVAPGERPGLQFRGTKSYLSPEALIGRLKVEKARAADLWSVGCVMAELMTGMTLITGDTAMASLKKIFELMGSSFQSYPKQDQGVGYLRKSLQSQVSWLPEAGYDLLERLLCVDPDGRITADAALAHPFFLDAVTGQPPAMIGWQVSTSSTVHAIRRNPSLTGIAFIDIASDDCLQGDDGENCSHNSSGSVHLSVQRTSGGRRLYDTSGPSSDRSTVAAHLLTLSNMRTTALFADGSVSRERTATHHHVTPTRRSEVDGISPSAHHPKRLQFDATPQPSPARRTLDEGMLLEA